MVRDGLSGFSVGGLGVMWMVDLFWGMERGFSLLGLLSLCCSVLYLWLWMKSCFV